MLTGQDYSDTPRSLSDSSVTWQEPSGTSLDANDRPRYGTINRSPTNRVAPESFEKMVKHNAKSPLSENMEQIKQIKLSSPSEFQFKKFHQVSSGAYSGVATGSFDPHRLPPMFEMVSTQKMAAEFAVPNISGEEIGLNMSYVSKSATETISKPAGVGTPSGSVGEDDMCVESPVNLTGSSNIPQSKTIASGEASPQSSGSESVFSQYPVYKVPFSNYGDRGIRPKTNTSEESNVSGLLYRQGYEGDDLDTKYKSHYLPPDYSQTSAATEPYSSLTEGRQYQSEMGEIYRLPKKMESKLYQQRYGGMPRKMKIPGDRRGSDTMQSFEAATLSSLIHLKEKEQELAKGQEMLGPADISKNFEEAVKIQQSFFHSSFGLLSPGLQRQFVTPGRPYPQRERSQSLSEFQTLTSHELSHAGRARFPSSSYAENLDAPLVIDDDSKTDIEKEGLDLSNKKRKMSVDEVYTAGVEDQQSESAAGTGNSGQQGDEEYDRMTAAQGQLQGGVTGNTRDESGASTKKYGKGNFIKVATGYQCRICCRVIRHMNNTTAHMRIHANVKPYKCQVCNQQFKYEVDRRYHFSKNHVDLFSKMYFPEEKKSG